MSPRPSFYWPLPYEVSRWFSAEEINTSKAENIALPGPGAVEGPALARDTELVELASRFGLFDTRFYVDRTMAEINGYVRLVDGQEAIILGRGLIEAPTSIRDWFVAHELAHIACQHSRSRLRFLGLCLVLLAIATLPLVVMSSSDWQPMVPIAFVLVSAIALVPLLAFWGRAMEREADWLASTKVARPDIRDFKAMYIQGSGDLDPSWLRRIRGLHPPPAERLEFLSRL